MKRTLEDLAAHAEMRANFELMSVRDVLAWDSVSLHIDTRWVYGRARDKGWKVNVSCSPPLAAAYVPGVKGRMTITRVS